MIIGCVLLAAGCGGPDIPSGQVNATVTFDGRPVEHGEVRLVSSQGAAVGIIETGGACTLRWKQSLEIPIGEYRVTITPPSLPAPTSADAPLPADDPRFPMKFRRIATTPLTLTVSGGLNVVEFDLAANAGDQ